MMISMRYFLVMMLMIMGNTMRCFDNLADLQKYAATHEEQPPSDDKDWLDPNYETFHKSLHPGFFKRLSQLIGLQKKPSWTPDDFEVLLRAVIEQREKQKLSGRLVAHIRLSKPAKFYIWGDLHGAFHSLVRALEWLHKKNIITNDLKIINPQHYFVFNGDAINRSPYTLETLSLLLLLLKRNKQQVFYIRGKHENSNYWHNFGLRRELRMRISDSLGEGIPLGSLVSQFFDTLPLALYISTTQNPTDVIRISHYGRDRFEINEEYFDDLWSDGSKIEVKYHDVRNKKKSKQPVTVQSIIKTEDWLRESRTMFGEPKGIFGLGLLDQERGAMTWAILSASIMPYQTYYNFFYDAFGVIDVTIPVKNSTITLYNQNLKKKDGFKKNKSFNLMTGIPIGLERGIAAGLTIGSSLSLVSGVPSMGQRVKRGMSARVREANQGIGGNNYHIKMVIYNDDYVPHLARNNIIRLMKNDEIDIILCPTGSPTLFSYLDYIKEDKILVLFPITGSNTFRKKDLVGLINFRETYADEVHALIDYVTTEHDAQRFAFFYQDDAYGVSALEAAHGELKKRGITEWTDVSYLRGSSEFSKQAKAIKLAQPDAIGFFSTALPTEELIRQIGVEFLAGKVLFGISFLGEELIRQFAKRKGITIYWGAVVPNPKISQLEIVKEYRKAMDRNNYTYDVFSLEAYIGTSIFIDMLQKIEGPVTREKVRQKLESLNNYQFKGLTLTFNPETRSLFESVWIETGDDEEWIEKKVKT